MVKPDNDGYIRLRRKEPYLHLVPKSPSVKMLLSPNKTTDEVVFRHGHIAITNYRMGDNWEFEKFLSVWDKQCYKYRFVGGYYVKRLRELRVNRAFNIHRLRDFFPHHVFRVDNNAYPSTSIDVSLYAEPRSDFQRVAMTFMAGQGEYYRNARYTQQMITAATGAGKTYLGVTSSALLSSRAVVIVPFKKLLIQWKESYLQFTDIKESEILVVQGSKACKKILDGEYTSVKVFILMVDTIVSFVERYGDLAAIDMFAAMNTYIKIVDEVHRDLKAQSMIEALCNFRMNYYLSASPGRTDRKEDRIFHALYYNLPKFGGTFERQDEKHINVLIKKYFFTPNPKQVNKMINRRTGMNTLTYEKILCDGNNEEKSSFEQALKVMLNWSKGIVAKTNRIMILAKTITFIEYIRAIAEEVFPGETSLYHGGLKPSEKEEALKARVIVATSSSLGTGADIPGLQHCYNCGTYSGKIEAIQTAGRLRKLQDPAQQSVYIELVNYGWKKTVAQYEKRKPFLIGRSKTGKLIVID